MTFASRRTRARGFTLIELAIVVVIVGILAVIAVAGYRKMVLSSKLTEATNMISAIRIAQEDYKTERGTYADLGTTFCPTDGSTLKKTGWDQTTCAGGAWAQLPVHADGPVQFGYRTKGGATGFADPFSLTWVNFTSANTKVPWYVVHAKADLDGDGGNFTEMVGTSFQNTLFSRNIGE